MPSPLCLPCPQDLKSLQSIKSKMAGGAARQSMALHAGGGPLGPSMLSRTSTPNVDLIKVGVDAGQVLAELNCGCFPACAACGAAGVATANDCVTLVAPRLPAGNQPAG